MVATIRQMHEQALAAQEAKAHVRPVPTTPSASTSRSVSPALSNSSGSSASTRTATPRTPRPQMNGVKGKCKGKDKARGRSTLQGLTSLSPPQLSPSISSASSQSIASATTSRTVTPASVNRSRPLSRSAKSVANGHAQSGYASSSHGDSHVPIPRPPRSSSLRPPTTVHAPSTLALIRSYIQTTLHSLTKSQLMALFLFFVVFPAISFVFRLRRRRIAAGLPGSGGTANAVRRRLRAGNEGVGLGLVGRVWEETVRAVMDTVRMGGRGLV